MPLEFQTALPPHVFGIPVQETPPSLSEFQDAARGMVWIFSGITQSYSWLAWRASEVFGEIQIKEEL